MGEDDEAFGEQTETAEIAGHTVEVRRQDDREELRIDGRRQRFFVTQDGYTLMDDAYAPPQKSLLDAAAHYLSKQPGERQA